MSSVSTSPVSIVKVSVSVMSKVWGCQHTRGKWAVGKGKFEMDGHDGVRRAGSWREEIVDRLGEGVSEELIAVHGTGWGIEGASFVV